MALTKATYSMIKGAPINVLDFGAVGDGVTDDTAAIQLALNQLQTISGELFFPAGVYKVSSQTTLTSGSKFSISGYGATIKAANGMTVGSGTQLLVVTGCSNFSISGIIFDGNRANRTPAEVTSHLLQLTNCQQFTLLDVQANNATTDGIYLNASNNAVSSTFCRDFILQNCKTDNAYRNGVSVINGLDFTFVGGAFTNSNGTLPKAGVDIESNAGAATPSNRSGRFFGSRFEGNDGYGLQISSEGSPDDFLVEGCYFANNDAGGVITGARLVVNGGLFENLATYGVKVSTVSTASAILTGVQFKNFTGTDACIDDGSLSIEIIMIDCTFNNIISAATPSGNRFYASGNTVKTCSGVAFNVSATCTAIIQNNYIEAATGRGIYSLGTDGLISGNRVVDIVAVSGGYIQAEGARNIISNNYCQSTVAAATTIGIRGHQDATEIAFNTCVNLHTTEPYSIQGTQSATSAFIAYNAGGTSNSARKAKFPLASASYSTGGRPAATTVPVGTIVFDTTTTKPNWSDGTNWRDATGTIV
jgi:hypothetical protein